MAKVRYLNESCNICGKRINSWDKRISKTLTYRLSIPGDSEPPFR